MAETKTLTWSKGVSAGRYLADADEKGGTRYTVVKEAGAWLVTIARTETVAGVVVSKSGAPVEQFHEDTLRDAKAVAAAYDARRDVRNGRMGAARTAAYGLA